MRELRHRKSRGNEVLRQLRNAAQEQMCIVRIRESPRIQILRRMRRIADAVVCRRCERKIDDTD
jgi:hypothetical protein